jgi:hypothetical protein
VASALTEWRRRRREAEFWRKARVRSQSLSKREIVDYIDTTLMVASQTVSRYRNATDRQFREDQLLELRINLEACLGMLENVLESP